MTIRNDQNSSKNTRKTYPQVEYPVTQGTIILPNHFLRLKNIILKQFSGKCLWNRNFYQRLRFSVNVPCSTWGLSGTKRIFSDMITLDEAK